MDIGFLIIILPVILFIVFCFYMAIKTSKNKKNIKKKNTQNAKEYEKRLSDKNAKFSVNLKHFYGLPITEGSLVDCYWCDDKIIFEGSGLSFNLSFEKLTDVSIKTDVEIQKQYVSSAGGAVAGAMMFGALGALIGGRTKEKTSKQVNKYLIFTYVNDEEVKYIAFDVYMNMGNIFVNAFKELNKSSTATIDL